MRGQGLTEPSLQQGIDRRAEQRLVLRVHVIHALEAREGALHLG